MAGWRDDLRQGSFRGVRFEFDDVNSSHGRRNHNHQYPFRDVPFSEDMGRKQRTYTINAFIVGDDYVSRKKSLIDACEKSGPGEFIHPLHGSFQVACESLDVRESKDSGRVATFSITFVEAGLQQFPAGLQNGSLLIGSSADSLIAAAQKTFQSSIFTTGVPEFVRTALQNTVGDVGGILNSIQSTGGLNLFQTSQSLINQAANMGALIKSFLPPSLSLITDKLGLSNSIISALKSLGDLAPSPSQAVQNYQKVQTLEVSTREPVTTLVAAENTNRTATKKFTDTVALAQEARYTALLDFPAYEDAIAARQSIVAKLDTAAGSAPDEEYYAIQDLRSQIVKNVPGESTDLPRLQTVTLPKSLPALKVAYDLYEDIDRAEDIAARNKAQHPGFLPGGTPLEVLSDA